MLSAKLWKLSATLRLLMGLFVCIYAASMADSVRHFAQTGTSSQGKAFYCLAVASFGLLAMTLAVLGMQWRSENFTRRMVALLVCFYAGFFGGAWMQKMAGVPGPSIAQIVIGTLGFHAAGLLLIWRFLREQNVSWTEAFGFAHERRQAVSLGFTVALVILPVGWGLQLISGYVMTHTPHLNVEPKEQTTVQVLRVTSSVLSRAVVGLMAIFLAPVTEEMLFRGILYPLVKQAGYPRLALWGVSLLFAAMHMTVVIFVPLLVLALALTLLYERTDNLLAPIITHAMFNALNFASLYLAPDK